jgi:hypothetical protein
LISGRSEWSSCQAHAVQSALLSAISSGSEPRAPKVKNSARMLYEDLHASRDYEGGYDSVRNVARHCASKSPWSRSASNAKRWPVDFAKNYDGETTPEPCGNEARTVLHDARGGAGNSDSRISV